MIDNNREAGNKGRCPKRRAQGQFWREPNRAKGEKCRVNRNTGANEPFYVFEKPGFRRWRRAKDEPQIGGGGGEANRRNPHHQRLIKTIALHEAIGGGNRYGGLQEQIERRTQAGAVVLSFDAQPTIPSEIDRQDSEVDHHPAENAANLVGIGEDRAMEMRVRFDWGD